MLREEEAIEIAKKYLLEKKIEYNAIFGGRLMTNHQVNYGEYIDTERDVYEVIFDYESYMQTLIYVVFVDVKLEEVLYTMTPHGYLEDWDT